ncbi:C69 family dipeptidase [Acidobacteriia bacterium AH_259_A11_L15]|nr:C69 family dipeptidase [Acidobacteriia bacterium AH_259_A11_L15]
MSPGRYGCCDTSPAEGFARAVVFRPREAAMCDVLVALPDATGNGKVVFGKNSDRPAGECQPLHYSPGGRRAPGSQVHCSYVTVPEVEHVLATFGCRPYWCWGYETGMNEAGVVGGNAAVFTGGLRRAAKQEKPGLTGMDLLRFALERGETAEQAVEVIIALLERYGQWGSAVQGRDHAAGAYDNSFLLADRREAWVLETSGRRWVAERITRGTRAISNQLSIRARWTKASPDLAAFARQNSWWSGDASGLDWARVYADHEHYSRQVSHLRWMRSRQLLERHRGALTVSAMMQILRDHYEDTFLQGPQFHPYLPDFMTLCMHDSPAGFTWGNTATSVVVELDPHNPAPPPFWLAYQPPCTSVYAAYFLGGEIPAFVTNAGTVGMTVRPPRQAPKDQFSENSLWWRCQRLLEEVRQNPLPRQRELRQVFDPVEEKNHARVEELLGKPSNDNNEPARLVAEEVAELTAALETLEHRWKLQPTGVSKGR